MGRQKYDGVVEAVRYAPDGNLSIARVYERRGSTFSDYILLSRAELIRRIKSRANIYGWQAPGTPGRYLRSDRTHQTGGNSRQGSFIYYENNK